MPTNTLYQPPTVDNAVYQAFGMQPNMDRLNLLPRYDKKVGWVAPNALYQLARAFMTPSVGFRGGEVTPEDALNFGMSVMGTSAGVSRAVPKSVPKGPAAGMATVYHGSPHNFDAFDATKIGTGEGAQAYGHGLYFADNPRVAKAYQVNLAKDPRDEINAVIDQLARKSGKGRVSVTPDELSIELSKNPILAPLIKENPGLLRDIQSLAYGFDGTAHTDSALAAARRLDSQLPQGKGNFYTADLPDSAIANMLDWDKPLSQQPDAVVNSIRSAFKDRGFSEDQISSMLSRDISGQQAYVYMAGAKGEAQASSLLNKHGIPGIRYLDGGSRAAGNGTRNYVVFDDKLLKILKKE